MSSAVKIGVLGGGYGAKVALPAYGALEQFEPVAVWSRHAERAQELAGEAGVSLGTADLDELRTPTRCCCALPAAGSGWSAWSPPHATRALT